MPQENDTSLLPTCRFHEARIVRLEEDLQDMSKETVKLGEGMKFLGEKIEEVSEKITKSIDSQQEALSSVTRTVDVLNFENTEKDKRTKTYKSIIMAIATAAAGALGIRLFEFLDKSWH